MLPGLTKGTYSLSDCVTLWANNFKRLKGIALNFHRLLHYAAGLRCKKCTGIDHPDKKL